MMEPTSFITIYINGSKVETEFKVQRRAVFRTLQSSVYFNNYTCMVNNQKFVRKYR